MSAPPPFFMDWQFWSAGAAWLALALTIAPHIGRRLTRPRIDVEVANTILLKHSIGDPGAQLHVALTNAVGHEVRLKAIFLLLQRGDETFRINAPGYFPSPDANVALMFVPVRLRPHSDWSYTVNFTSVGQLDRLENKMIRERSSQLRNDILVKRMGLEKDAPDVSGESKLWEPLVQHFNSAFKWIPGEYQASLVVETEPPNAAQPRKFRFTIFESESQDLRSVVDDIKFGAGVFVAPHPDRPGVVTVPLSTV